MTQKCDQALRNSASRPASRASLADQVLSGVGVIDQLDKELQNMEEDVQRQLSRLHKQHANNFTPTKLAASEVLVSCSPPTSDQSRASKPQPASGSHVEGNATSHAVPEKEKTVGEGAFRRQADEDVFVERDDLKAYQDIGLVDTAAVTELIRLRTEMVMMDEAFPELDQKSEGDVHQAELTEWRRVEKALNQLNFHHPMLDSNDMKYEQLDEDTIELRAVLDEINSKLKVIKHHPEVDVSWQSQSDSSSMNNKIIEELRAQNAELRDRFKVAAPRPSSSPPADSTHLD